MFKSIKSYFFAGVEDDKVPDTTSTMKPVESKSSSFRQTVQFEGSDDQHSTAIVSSDVTIIPSAGNHDKSSSHVKTNNIVDHSWDVRFYKGQLLAVHLAGKFIAFGIQVVSKSESMVRIVNRKNNHRYLCKGITGVVQDIAFAHIATQVVLGIVDEAGTLFVYRIEDTPDALQTKLILHVSQKSDPKPTALIHRLIWCPYIPEEDSDSKDEDEEVANMLVVTHGPRAEIWNVEMVVQSHGVDKELHPEDVKEGLLVLNQHALDIVDAAFSPDGTALATASLDGYVKFFQVYMQGSEQPRCLHMWQPHDGKQLSSLFFLDNHRSHTADTQFWKYVLTGSENNSELKIWSCESWSCLQTIRFAPNITSAVPGSISLKAGIDLSADFIMLSDINNRVLYVLQLQKDTHDSSARVCAASEFLLPNPILSFGIVDAGIRTVKSHHDVTNNLETDLMDNNDDDEDDAGEEDDDEKSVKVVVRMYVVHPKSLRGCLISFDPPEDSKKTLSIFSDDTLAFTEALSDVSDNSHDKGGSNQNSVTSTLALAGTDGINNVTPIPELRQSSEPKCLNSLMTPDDFSSSSEKTDIADGTKTSPLIPSPLIPVSEHLGAHLGDLSAEKTKQQADPTPKLDRVSKTRGKSNGKAMADVCLTRKREPTASGGSSPSREVEEILSHGSSDCLSSTMSFSFANEDLKSVKTETNIGTVAVSETNLINAPSKPCNQLPLPLPTSLQASALASTTSALQAVVAAAQEKQPVMVTAEQLEKQQTQWSRVDLLLETLQQQQVEIKNLRQELGALRLSHTASSEIHSGDKIQALLVSQQKQLEMSIQNAVQNALQNSVQNLLRSRDQQEAQRQEAVMLVVSQTVSNIISTQLPTLISQEIQNEVVPLVRTNIQQMKQQVATEVATKLAATDQLMKDNLAKLVNNKSFMDSLNQSLLLMAQPTLQSLYKESFATLVPGMEKVTQSMFHQINSSFSKGTQEYLQYVDGTVEKQRRQAERAQEMLIQLQSVAESMQVAHEQQTLMIKTTLENQLQRLQNSLQEKLNKTVSETVKGNLAQGFKQQKAVIEESVLTSLSAARSRAVSPAHSVSDYASMERRVLSLIQEGDYNLAFQQALSASSIQLVLTLCERVDPQKLFSCQPFPLKQNVLLSLIQQLSVDLNDQTDLKRRYLEEAVMSLDPNDADVRKHMYIIGKLQDQLMAYLHAHPSSPLMRQMKILYMATSNLVHSPTSPSS